MKESVRYLRISECWEEIERAFHDVNEENVTGVGYEMAIDRLDDCIGALGGEIIVWGKEIGVITEIK